MMNYQKKEQEHKKDNWYLLGRKFDLGLLDKRYSFSFSMVRMLYMSNNMSSKVFYA